MTIYAIGDIHGELEMLREMLGLIQRDAAARPGPHKAVFLGDYVDRGPDSPGVLNLLMARPLPFETVFLRGNHEDMAVSNKPLWLYNGGGWDITQSHVDWINNATVFSHRDGIWFFAHAGVNPLAPLDQQDERHLLWIRRPFLDYSGDFGAIVVHGHTPVEKPEIKENRINVDTGACYGGALSCAVLTDKLERIIQVTGRRMVA